MRLPLFLDLHGRRVLVVGGGDVARRRAERLVETGADVHVVAPDIGEGLNGLPITVTRRAWQPQDIEATWLVVACTDRPDVNAAVAEAAERAGIWCVRSDAALQSAAWLPAATSVDDVAVAITAGGDPRRARELRDAIDGRLRMGDLAARPQRSHAGRVVLVGGGPGDPDLLTLKGFRALQAADVVVTDRLGPTDLLARLPADVEVVDVGKDPRGHAAAQDDINTLIVQRAQAGQVVVRLKGGDPFVLGRGTEEVDACLAAGVTVEVIPGVTSATAGATLAGIPLTERGTTQQFTVVSGHLSPEDPRSSVDWDTLALGSGTLVVLMGVTHLAAIAARLIAAGRDPSTPAVVVADASLPGQRVVASGLSELASRAVAEDIAPPAVVVIGEVASRLVR